MNLKRSLFLTALLCLFGMSYQITTAQIAVAIEKGVGIGGGSSSACQVCNTTVHDITVNTNATAPPLVRYLGSHTSGSYQCQAFDYIWDIKAPGATVNCAGGQCQVIFQEAGDYEVCLTYVEWKDSPPYDGQVSGRHELCWDKRCETISIASE